MFIRNVRSQRSVLVIHYLSLGLGLEIGDQEKGNMGL